MWTIYHTSPWELVVTTKKKKRAIKYLNKCININLSFALQSELLEKMNHLLVSQTHEFNSCVVSNVCNILKLCLDWQHEA